MADIVARLEIESGNGTRLIPIELGGVCSIGRGTQNTIMLEDSSVSRKHALIDCQSSYDCYVTDAGGRNGPASRSDSASAEGAERFQGYQRRNPHSQLPGHDGPCVHAGWALPRSPRGAER